jgi:hypothetical protein
MTTDGAERSSRFTLTARPYSGGASRLGIAPTVKAASGLERSQTAPTASRARRELRRANVFVNARATSAICGARYDSLGRRWSRSCRGFRRRRWRISGRHHRDARVFVADAPRRVAASSCADSSGQSRILDADDARGKPRLRVELQPFFGMKPCAATSARLGRRSRRAFPGRRPRAANIWSLGPATRRRSSGAASSRRPCSQPRRRTPGNRARHQQPRSCSRGSPARRPLPARSCARQPVTGHPTGGTT